MLYEYAVEPSVLGTWDSFRYFFEKFGVGEGRLIAKYPKQWKAMVWAACANASPLAKARIEVKLEHMDRKLSKNKRAYREKASWLDNALDAHDEDPFHAIISVSSHESPCVLAADELDDDAPLWKVERDGKVARKANALAAVVESLLHLSTEIIFVDQHFGLTAKHCRPLTSFLTAARRGKPLARSEYHLNARVSAEYFQEELKHSLHFLRLRPDESVVFVRWRCIDGGENQHPRYILTNRGGVRFDYGLDEGDGTTDWSRLSEDLWQQRRKQFSPDAGAFEWADAWKVSADRVTRVKWSHSTWIPAT